MLKRTLLAAAASMLLALPAMAQTSLGVGAGTGVQVQVPGVGVGVGTGAGAQSQTQSPCGAAVGTDMRGSGRATTDTVRTPPRGGARVNGSGAVNGQAAPGNGGVGAGANQGLQLGIGR